MRKNRSTLGIILVCALFCLLLVDVSRAEIIDEDILQPALDLKKTDKKPLEESDSKKDTDTEKNQALESIKAGGSEKEKKVSSPNEKSKFPGPKKPMTKSTQSSKEKKPVNFTSQGLKGLREKGLVELVKDVLVTQGDLKIEADNAQVYFSEDTKEVQRIVALGQPVKMSNIDPNSGEKLEAYGNQIVFDNSDRVVHLEGNARIKKGSNSTIKGKKITYELDSGWIRADKVAGEISPKD